jgi:hypothetical protein
MSSGVGIGGVAAGSAGGAASWPPESPLLHGADSRGEVRFADTGTSGVLAETVKSAVVEYMRFHGYSDTLRSFMSESSSRPPGLDTVDLGTSACCAGGVTRSR